MKRCTQCNTNKSLSDFSRDRSRKDGYRDWCKICQSSHYRAYYKKNKKEILRKNAVYFSNNQEKCRTIVSNWAKKNPERTRQHAGAWKKRNRDKTRGYLATYRARKHSLPSSFTTEDWIEIQDAFDNRCVYCGESGELEQDHFLPLSLGGGYVRGNILPACRSCNATKGSKHPRLFVEEGNLRQPFNQLLRKLAWY